MIISNRYMRSFDINSGVSPGKYWIICFKLKPFLIEDIICRCQCLLGKGLGDIQDGAYQARASRIEVPTTRPRG